jgi:hypothetical protein
MLSILRDTAFSRSDRKFQLSCDNVDNHMTCPSIYTAFIVVRTRTSITKSWQPGISYSSGFKVALVIIRFGTKKIIKNTNLTKEPPRSDQSSIQPMKGRLDRDLPNWYHHSHYTKW